MDKFKPYRRSNEFDRPSPAVVQHEWIVTGPGAMQWAISPQLAQPDTDEGQVRAQLMAQALDAAYALGAKDKARHIRHSYNDFIESMGEDE